MVAFLTCGRTSLNPAPSSGTSRTLAVSSVPIAAPLRRLFRCSTVRSLLRFPAAVCATSPSSSDSSSDSDSESASPLPLTSARGSPGGSWGFPVEEGFGPDADGNKGEAAVAGPEGTPLLTSARTDVWRAGTTGLGGGAGVGCEGGGGKTEAKGGGRFILFMRWRTWV